MTAERVAALEKIGFEWGLDYDRLLQTRYDELITFNQKYGQCDVSYKDEHNNALGLWVSKQRYYYGLLYKDKPSYMTVKRVAALEKIRFEWNRYYLTQR